MNSINRRINLVIIVFLIFTSFFVYVSIYKPLIVELEKEMQTNYILIAENKHQLFERHLQSVGYNAAAISSRSVIRDMLADYLEGNVTLEALREFSIPRFKEGVDIIDELIIAARFSTDGQLLYSVGSDMNAKDLIRWDKEDLYYRYIPEKNFIMVQSPVKQGNIILAYDVIVSDVNSTIMLLEEELYELTILEAAGQPAIDNENGKITAFMDCELIEDKIAISADEVSVFDSVRKLAIGANIRYFILIAILFPFAQFFIMRFVSRFVNEQEVLKFEAEDREEILQNILDITGEGVWIWNIEEGYVKHNRRWCTILGLDESFLTHNLDDFVHMIHADDREGVLKAINDAAENQGKYYREYRMIQPNGNIIWVIDRGILLKKTEGKSQRMIGSLTDITQRKAAQLALFLEKETFQSTLLSVGDGIIATDVDGIITVINPVAIDLTGFGQEAIGKSVYDVLNFIHTETNESVDTLLTSTNEVLIKSSSGKELRISKVTTPIYMANGEITGYVMVFRDVTEMYEKQQKIEYLSFHDELTGLYNRRYFEDCMHRMDTLRNIPFTIMMLDLNNLKLTNDIFGHAMGDRLIKLTADFLRSILRSDDIVARIGGDEFCILMPKTSDEAASLIKERVQSTASQFGLELMPISIAVGYAMKTKKTERIEDILREADSNMYKDKQDRRQMVQNIIINRFLESNNQKSEAEKEHDHRVGIFASALYRAIGKSDEEVKKYLEAVHVHDIGKIIVPKEILNNKDPLTNSDWEMLKKHPQSSYEILRLLKADETYLDAILYHHERMDGKGYPKGLQGHEIPLEARIISVADAYEAMTANRPHKMAMSQEAAVEELKKNAGTQLDAELVEIFINKVLKV